MSGTAWALLVLGALLLVVTGLLAWASIVRTGPQDRGAVTVAAFALVVVTASTLIAGVAASSQSRLALREEERREGLPVAEASLARIALELGKLRELEERRQRRERRAGVASTP